MGKTVDNGKRGDKSNLSSMWYIEQMLKLRKGKLSREDANYLKNSKLDLLVPPLRLALALYFFFDTLFLIEDAVEKRNTAHFVVRYVVTVVVLILTFSLTFTRNLYKRRFFSILTYICILLQSASTSIYLYWSVDSKEKDPPLSPFLPMDIFFLFFFVRIHIGVTLLCSVIALVVNEIIVITVSKDSGAMEVGSVVLYLLCILVGMVTGFIAELNFKTKYILGKEVAKDRAMMANEREKSEKLLYNILPRSIADSLKNDFLSLGDKDRETDIIADNFDDTTIGFCDICDFTVMSGEMNPEKLVGFLNDVFSSFDNLVHEFGLEKIKTIGDAYMFVGGLSKSPLINTKHGSFTPAEAVAEMALCMQDAVDVVSKKLELAIKVRVGINSGSVVAGIVGISKFVYDLFGETVNMSAKMESSGQPKRVHVSHATYSKLVDKYDFEPAQDVEVKDKFIKTYFLLGRKGREEGRVPTLSVVPAVPASPTTQQNNLMHFLSSGPSESDISANFSPAKPLKREHHIDRGDSRPVSPIRPMQLDVPSSILPPSHFPSSNDQVEPLNPHSSSFSSSTEVLPPSAPAPFDVGGVIYPMRLKPTGDSDSDLGPMVQASRRQPQKGKPPSYPVIARSTSNGSLDKAPSDNRVIRNRGSFTSQATSATIESNIDMDPIAPPDLGLRDLLSFTTHDLEIRYRKDYWRKFSRMMQFHALASWAVYITVGVILLATLPGTDYGVLLAFGAGALVIAAVVFVYFAGDEGRAYMHYLPAIQSIIASTGLVVLVIIIIERNDNFEHHLLAWDSAIIMVTFTFVFSGIPFLHTLTVSLPIMLVIIAAVAAMDGDFAFRIIIRLIMLMCVGSIMSYRKEIENRLSYYVTQIMDDERRKLVAEKTKSEKLLYAILPQKIAQKLKSNDKSIADTYHDVTVMFVSIHNFTSLTAGLNHFEQVSLLNKIFSKFDKVCEAHKLEKIKTIGPTYLVVGGLPQPKPNHLAEMGEMALELQEAIQTFRAPNGEKYKIKAGIHCGKVVAGVIGIYKFSYDLWGDTVNTASRMETHSLPGQIQVTETCQKKMAAKFEFTDRGFIQVKGKGVMHTFFLTKSLMKKMPTSASTDRIPNVVTGHFSD